MSYDPEDAKCRAAFDFYQETGQVKKWLYDMQVRSILPSYSNSPLSDGGSDGGGSDGGGRAGGEHHFDDLLLNNLRRRKVRCNEIRPICGHCSRLNLECRWRPSTSVLSTNGTSSTPDATRRKSDGPNGNSKALPTPVPPTTSSAQESFDDVFNYASFMWDGPEMWKPSSWAPQDLAVVDQGMPNAMMVCQLPSTSRTLLTLLDPFIFRTPFASGWKHFRGFPGVKLF